MKDFATHIRVISCHHGHPETLKNCGFSRGETVGFQRFTLSFYQKDSLGFAFGMGILKGFLFNIFEIGEIWFLARMEHLAPLFG